MIPLAALRLDPNVDVRLAHGSRGQARDHLENVGRTRRVAWQAANEQFNVAVESVQGLIQLDSSTSKFPSHDKSSFHEAKPSPDSASLRQGTQRFGVGS